MSEQYSTNLAAQFKWGPSSGKPGSPLTAVVAGSSSGNRAVQDIRTVELLEYALDGKTRETLCSYLVEKHDLVRAEAEHEVEELIESGLLLENHQQVEGGQTWFEHDWDRSLYYHLSTRDESVIEPRVYEQELETATQGDRDVIELPTPEEVPDEPLDKVLLDRRTCRDFDGSPIDSTDLSSILYHALAPIRKATRDDEQNVSDGASFFEASRFPLTIYPVVARSPDVESGVYRYELERHSLRNLDTEYTEKETDDLLQSIVVNQPFIEDAPVTLVISTDIQKFRHIHPQSMGLRHLFTVVSTHAHRLLLTANAFGFDVFQCAALKDSLADGVVGADGFDEAVVYTLTIGRETEEDE
ncbi:nitroreductase family protein [Halorussus salilacus]|uniref:nitroreductase family protein n=1 Tax=Halorussus salilacus TaxID=2953750 RepID=UPI0020A11FEC|nr:nitroreductase family protein [Halorussus salilacus]USZ66718.1 nitroreductase family protein [Halorussus salilacus]